MGKFEICEPSYTVDPGQAVLCPDQLAAWIGENDPARAICLVMIDVIPFLKAGEDVAGVRFLFCCAVD